MLPCLEAGKSLRHFRPAESSPGSHGNASCRFLSLILAGAYTTLAVTPGVDEQEWFNGPNIIDTYISKCLFRFFYMSHTLMRMPRNS